MKTIVSILLFTSSWTFAQTTIILQGGIGARAPIIPLQHRIYAEESWKSASSGVVGIEYFFTKSVAITSNIEYDSYPLNIYSGVVTYNNHDYEAVGSSEATRIYRTSLEGKFIAPSHDRFSLYLVIGASYTIEHIPPINLSTLNPNAYSQIPTQDKYYWMHTLGLGWRCSIFDKLGIDLTGKLYSDYTTHIHESLMFGIFYVI